VVPAGSELFRLIRQSRLEWRGEVAASELAQIKPGQKVSRKRAPPPVQVLGFTWDEVREARLAPIVSFKGRGAGNPGDAPES
jgi:ribosome maturation factor RimP